jgi:hypothetical protein
LTAAGATVPTSGAEVLKLPDSVALATPAPTHCWIAPAAFAGTN